MYIKIPPVGPITFLTKKQFRSHFLDLEHVTIDDIGQLRLGMYVQSKAGDRNTVGSAILFCGKYASMTRDMGKAVCEGDVYVYNDKRDITLQDIHDVFFKEREQVALTPSLEPWMVANVKYEQVHISNTNINLRKHCVRLFEIYKSFEGRIPNPNRTHLFRERKNPLP